MCSFATNQIRTPLVPLNNNSMLQHFACVGTFDMNDPDTACTSGVNSETGTCYWLTESNGSYDDGESSCSSKGGLVAYMKTQATMNFMDNAGLLGYSVILSSYACMHNYETDNISVHVIMSEM